MAMIRIIKEALLDVLMDEKVQTVYFEVGIYHPVHKIEKDPNGFCNLFFANGAVARGVFKDVFENYGVPEIPINVILPSDENKEQNVQANAEPKIERPRRKSKFN